jgi:hypothetical protein
MHSDSHSFIPSINQSIIHIHSHFTHVHSFIHSITLPFLVLYDLSAPPPRLQKLRGNRFIYRGGPVEHITVFVKRLLTKWPFARQALPNEEISDDAADNGAHTLCDPVWVPLPTPSPPSHPSSPMSPRSVDFIFPVFLESDDLAAIRLSSVHPAHICHVPLTLRPQLGLPDTPCSLDDLSFFATEESPSWSASEAAETVQQSPAARSLYAPEKWFRIAPEIRLGLLHDEVRLWSHDIRFRFTPAID